MKKIIIKLFLELLFIGLLISLDLLTKIYIYGPISFGEGDIILIPGVLRFTSVENTGASFGIFANHTIILSIVSLITIIGAIVAQVLTINKLKSPLFRIALSLIVAGGIGNLIDRFTLSYVRDFIYFELIDFAVFNIADSCLTIGCILLIIFIIFDYGRSAFKKDKGE